RSVRKRSIVSTYRCCDRLLGDTLFGDLRHGEAVPLTVTQRGGRGRGPQLRPAAAPLSFLGGFFVSLRLPVMLARPMISFLARIRKAGASLRRGSERRTGIDRRVRQIPVAIERRIKERRQR